MNQDEKINVLECVPVIQGEGRSTGVPMILIRLSGCNLNCQFKGSICDASETSWDHNNKTAKKWSISEMRDVLRNNSHINRVMITGGQPTLYKALFFQVVDLCLEENKLIEVEDNGTTYIEDLNPRVINLMSISPKLKNSIPEIGTYAKEIDRYVTATDRKKHILNYRNIESLKNWISRFHYQLKFVVSDEDELQEIEDLIKEIGADKSKVFLMPEGATREQLESRRKWVYETCLRLGYNYTDRLHILVYDNLKGV